MSGYVPGCENDLFISYAHADDLPWVQAFEKSLGEELSRRLGLGISVWQDGKRLRVGQNWQVEIELGVKEAAIFVAILSPSYRSSSWCADERGLFIQLFTPESPFETSNRFFKILKTPWENDGHKHFLAAIQSQDFFRREDGPAGDVEFLPGSDDFRKAVSTLAQSAAQTLRKLRRGREHVFVASPAAECRDVWDQLRAELTDQDYAVQPAGRLDRGFDDTLVRDEMDRALLSVHLLGAAYDPFVEHQIRLACELDQRLMFWLGPGADATSDASQKRLIKALSNGERPDRPGVALPSGWMLLPPDVTPRRLIEEVLAALKPKRPAVEAQPTAEGASRVYIVHDPTTEEDTRIASELRDQIVQREGLNVFLSRSDLPSADERHEKLMQTCEGVLLCRRAAPERWLRQTAPEVILAEKLLRRSPLKSRAFLVDDPVPWNGTPGLQVYPYGPQFRIGDLEPFLAPLRP